MIAIADKKYKTESTVTWQESFLKLIPTIERHARFAFRRLDDESKTDAISEVVANAMCAFRRLYERGELQRVFATSLAKYAVKQFRAGRRVGTPQSSRDVCSRVAQKKAGFGVRSIDDPSPHDSNWMDGLVDDRRTPIPDQVAFRIDFPAWMADLSTRNQHIVERMSQRFTTDEVAAEFQVSRSRVSQLRREFANSWEEFNSAAGDGSGRQDNQKNQHTGEALCQSR